jgi:hypothetical protein
MPIRSYQPGDEVAQARIYNEAAGPLPGFKPSTPEEIARRYRTADADPGSRFYAVADGEVVGYAVFGADGRVSYPWCRPGAEAWREPLLGAAIEVMRRRGLSGAWAAYRADWAPVLDFLRQQGFAERRRMINFLADASALPARQDLPPDRVIGPLELAELPRLATLTPALFPDSDPRSLEAFYRDNPFQDLSKSLVALREAGTGALLAAGLLVVDDRFANPAQVDAAMPCFRFGAFGTERQRHKRLNGLVSVAFTDEAEGDLLLAWLIGTRARPSGLAHIAAQAPSDASRLCTWYDRYFSRQGSFPILMKDLVS